MKTISLYNTSFDQKENITPKNGWTDIHTFLSGTDSPRKDIEINSDADFPKHLRSYTLQTDKLEGFTFNLVVSGNRAYWCSRTEIGNNTTLLNLSYDALLSNCQKTYNPTARWVLNSAVTNNGYGFKPLPYNVNTIEGVIDVGENKERGGYLAQVLVYDASVANKYFVDPIYNEFSVRTPAYICLIFVSGENGNSSWVYYNPNTGLEPTYKTNGDKKDVVPLSKWWSLPGFICSFPMALQSAGMISANSKTTGIDFVDNGTMVWSSIFARLSMTGLGFSSKSYLLSTAGGGVIYTTPIVTAKELKGVYYPNKAFHFRCFTITKNIVIDASLVDNEKATLLYTQQYDGLGASWSIFNISNTDRGDNPTQWGYPSYQKLKLIDSDNIEENFSKVSAETQFRNQNPYGYAQATWLGGIFNALKFNYKRPQDYFGLVEGFIDRVGNMEDLRHKPSNIKGSSTNAFYPIWNMPAWPAKARPASLDYYFMGLVPIKPAYANISVLQNRYGEECDMWGSLADDGLSFQGYSFVCGKEPFIINSEIYDDEDRRLIENAIISGCECYIADNGGWGNNKFRPYKY